MKTEIIAVGTELLLGQVVNTNAAFLSQELASLGFEVYYQSVVGDNPERLEEALREADNRSDLIILCGGLGPTEDDLTKEVVAKHLGEKLVLDQNAMDKIKKFVERSGRALTDNNCRQALFIEHNQCVKNPAGLAVGCFVNKNGKNYLLLPGPPSELQAMFFQEARPLLQSLLPQKDQLISRVLRFYGTGESQLVTELADLIEHQENPTLAPYAKANEVTLRLTVKALNEKEGKDLLDELEFKIMAQVGEFFYGYGDENSLEAVTVDLLIKANKTITSAESLTGGLFQSTLVNIPGVSQIFPGGFVTYSIREKMNLLKISSKVIERYGVVSEECAKEMADHARVLLDTDYALSFTGVAGPEELEGKEPGTVWIGLAKRGKETSATLFHFNRDRNYARQSAVMAGLNLIRKDLLEEKK